MNKVRLHILVGLLLVVLSSPGWADFEAGHEAFYRGDYSAAIKEWKPLAEKGHAEAQLNLAYMYAQGKGVPRDYVEAVKWYRRAAVQGVAEAQTELATMYVHGYGVPQDVNEAAKWYRKAADQNDANAIFGLASMYANGLGFKQDFRKAFQLGLTAANMDAIGGQMLVAQLYARGQGVEQDNVQALMWLRIVISKAAVPVPEFQSLAARALEASRSLMAGMTEEDIREASRLAREWKPRAEHTPP